jgi:hypothetical protein
MMPSQIIGLGIIAVTVLLAVVPRTSGPGAAWLAFIVVANGAAMLFLDEDDPRRTMVAMHSFTTIGIFVVVRLARKGVIKMLPRRGG